MNSYIINVRASIVKNPCKNVLSKLFERMFYVVKHYRKSLGPTIYWRKKGRSNIQTTDVLLMPLSPGHLRINFKCLYEELSKHIHI